MSPARPLLTALPWLLAAPALPPVSQWPYLPTLERLALAVAIGLFVGLERERRGKEAGVRTFGFAALLGCFGGLLGSGYGILCLALLGVLVILLNAQTLSAGEGVELTTSAALLVTGAAGVLCGTGHTFTPVAIAVISAALLAWKESLTEFSLGLTEAELRSAILLAVLAFIVYPILPAGTVDPWGLINPRVAWVTVLLIAGIGFGNYVLLKRYGKRGVELTGFLGGLVNSTVTVTEIGTRLYATGGALLDEAYRGVMLSTSAMVARNAVLLGIFAPRALLAVALPLGVMFVSSAALVLRRLPAPASSRPAPPAVQVTSPFSLFSVLRFGALFLALQVAGTLAERGLGHLGFYAVSLLGGLVSSASAVASAATLAAHGSLPAETAGVGALLASIASVLVNVPLLVRVGRQRRLAVRLVWASGVVVVLSVIGVLLQGWLFALAQRVA